MAKTAKEVIKRLTAPEVREIVKELQSVVKLFDVKFDSMTKLFDSKLESAVELFDSRFDSLSKDVKAVDLKVEELGKRFDLAQKVFVLEAEVREIRQKLSTKS